jgi:putative ATP-binding cassette transporter
VLIDDMFGSLDDDALERVTEIFANELAQTSLIHIGKAAQAHHPIFTRVLHLIKAPSKGTASRDKTAAVPVEKESKIGSQ